MNSPRLTSEDFTCLRQATRGRQARRAPRPDLGKFTLAHDETAAHTEQIQTIEQRNRPVRRRTLQPVNSLFKQKRTKVGVVSSNQFSVPFVSFCATPSERGIDERLYRLHVLTPDEIKLVQEASP